MTHTTTNSSPLLTKMLVLGVGSTPPCPHRTVTGHYHLLAGLTRTDGQEGPPYTYYPSVAPQPPQYLGISICPECLRLGL